MAGVFRSRPNPCSRIPVKGGHRRPRPHPFFFNVAAFVGPNKRSSHGKRVPNATCVTQNHREQRCHELVALLNLPSMTESLLPLCGLAHASSTSSSINFSQLPTLQRTDFPVFLPPSLPPFLLIRDVGAGPTLLGGEIKGIRLHTIHHLS